MPKEEPKAARPGGRNSAQLASAFDLREHTHLLHDAKEAARGFTYYTCPGCGGQQKLFVNEATGAYGCFHIANGTCSIEAIREGLGRPKVSGGLPARRLGATVKPAHTAANATAIATPPAAPQAAAQPSQPEGRREVLFDGRLTLEVSPAPRGKSVLIARNCTAVLHRDEISLSKAADRAQFIKQLALAADEQDGVQQALLRLADQVDQLRAAVAGELGELGERLPGGLTISQQLIQMSSLLIFAWRSTPARSTWIWSMMIGSRCASLRTAGR